MTQAAPGGSGLTRFSISVPSRHPADADGYDPHRHTYKPDYVRPADWQLALSYMPTGFREVRDGHYELPADVASYKWQITLLGGDFSRTLTMQRSSFRLAMPLRVPKPGTYLISLEVTRTDGRVLTSRRRFRLRDCLVIGIGDSFASGQGNPDAPAVPAPDQTAFCKATSPALVAYGAEQALRQFLDDVGDASAAAIESLPYAGKVVLAVGAGVSDVHSYIKDRIDDLTGYSVSIGRTALAVVGEGVEEILSWVGIGDGGERSDTDPRPAAWQEPNAYRSYRSGQSLAAAHVQTSSSRGADRVTFLGFGRTGAEIDNGLLGPRTISRVVGHGDVRIDAWTGNRGEVQEAADTIQSREVDALIITIGINDVGFSSLVTNAILKASGEARRKRIAGLRNRIATMVPEQLDQLKAAVDSQLKPRRVLLTSYPVNVFGEIAAGAEPCGVLGSTYVRNLRTLKGFDLDGPDARDFGAAGLELNEVLKRKAEQFGWLFVDGIRQGFAGHGYCAARSFFVSAEESCLNQGDFEGMLHPNQSGHNLTRDCIAKALGPQLFAEHWVEPALHMTMV